MPRFIPLFSVLLFLPTFLLAQTNYFQDFSDPNRSNYWSECYHLPGISLKEDNSRNTGFGYSARTSQLTNPNGTAYLQLPAMEFDKVGFVSFNHWLNAFNGSFRRFYIVLRDPSLGLRDTIYTYEYRDRSMQTVNLPIDTLGVFQIEFHWQGSGGSSRGWLDNVASSGEVLATSGNGCSANSTIFPVEWGQLNTTWTAGGALVQWETASELNTDYFEVERRDATGGFEPLGALRAAGHSTKTKVYAFQDREASNLGERTLYYRIKQVDLDGTFAYSQVMSVTPQSHAQLQLAPNPSQGLLRVELLQSDQAFDLQIFNHLGQGVYRHSHALTATAELNLQHLPNGLYWVKATHPEQQLIQKLLLR